MRRRLRVEHKDPVVRSRRTKESVEVYYDFGGERGGAGGMKDAEAGIIVHDQGILREWFRTVGAPFRETPNSCPKALFVVEDEHMAFSYTNSWKLARSAASPALLKKSVRIGQGADKGLCQLDGSIRVNHVMVHTRMYGDMAGLLGKGQFQPPSIKRPDALQSTSWPIRPAGEIYNVKLPTYSRSGNWEQR
jgi:hypothetical protein